MRVGGRRARVTRVPEITVESVLPLETKREFGFAFEIIEEDGRTRLIPRRGMLVYVGCIESREATDNYYLLFDDDWMDFIKLSGNSVVHLKWKDADSSFRRLLAMFVEYLVRKYEEGSQGANKGGVMGFV